MKKFAITGVSGYIAPKHLQAIKDTGNVLSAALDPHDSAGILDGYFADTAFFTETERFDRHLEKLRQNGNGVDFLTICSPNYLHDAHIKMALRLGANALCEKPLVLNPENLDILSNLEKESGKKVFCVLQLRYHPVINALKKQIQLNHDQKLKVKLHYITPRGPWYHYSWKGNTERSGGLATNIGIHLFDMLIWLFGNLVSFELHTHNKETVSGNFEFEKAEVEWLLSISREELAIHTGNLHKARRKMWIDGEETDFSDGFEHLHTKVYSEVLQGRGFGIEAVRPSIELAYAIRNADAISESFFS